MIYLLDTNAVSKLMRQDGRMAAWLSSLRGDDELLTCSIVRGEILFGIERLEQGRRRAELTTKAQIVFASMRCLSVEPSAGDAYARTKLAQQLRGLSLDDNDLWIAATAISIGATLVSDDSDFDRIDQLTVAGL